MKIIDRSFFDCDSILVAKKLLGKYIVLGNMVGKIVETEAYLQDDPASHSFLGKTERNYSMFERAGTAYVYFTYGMHYCFNIVTNKRGVGEAVLIRAVEPIRGIDEMISRRKGVTDIRKLCNGPAKFTSAFGIDRRFDGVYLISNKSPIRLMKGKEEAFEIVSAKRIGIKKAVDLPYRFYIKGSKFVSRN